MGLAVLPSRLVEKLDILCETMLTGADLTANPKTVSHAEWAENILKEHTDFCAENADEIIKSEVDKVFEQVLADAGVFKINCIGQKAFNRFIETIR